MPLYISILYKVMQEKGNHEGCIKQIYRLFNEHLSSNSGPNTLDEKGRIRIDDWEMQEDVQNEVAQAWDAINTENLSELSNFDEYRAEFLRLFGFGLAEIDYEAETDPVRHLPSAQH